MAEEIGVLPFLTPDVTAVEDLRTFQFRAVEIHGTGVRLAGTTQTSGRPFILHNKPDSGQPCALVGPGNVTKCIVGDTAVTRGQHAYVAASGGFVGPLSGNSAGHGLKLGVFLSATANSAVATILLT